MKKTNIQSPLFSLLKNIVLRSLFFFLAVFGTLSLRPSSALATPGEFYVLSSSMVGVSTITHSFQSDAAGTYHLLRSTSPDLGNPDIAVIATIALSSQTATIAFQSDHDFRTPGTLTPNTTYFFRAFFPNTETLSPLVSTATRARAPVSSGFNVYKTSIAVNVFAGDNPIGLSSGTVFRVEASSDGFETVNFSSSGLFETLSSNLFVEGLTPNTSYQIGLTAINHNDLVSTRTIVTTTFTVVDVPGAFNAFTPASIGVSSITINWSNGSNNLTLPTTFYEIQLTDTIDNDGNFVGITQYSTITLVTSSYTFVNGEESGVGQPVDLQPNTTYYFRVRQYQRGGEFGSGEFNSAIATTTLIVSPTSNSFIVNKTSITATQLSSNPLGSTYRLEVSSDGFNSIDFSSTGLVNTLTISGLSPNTTYQVAFVGINYNGVASSRTVFATTSTLAGDVGSFTAFTPAGVGISSLSISFSAGENSLLLPTSFNVQISTDANFAVFSTSDTYALTVTTQTLTPNTSYYFRARTYGRGGDLGIFNASIATFTLTSSPAASGFVVNKSSISVNIASNGNAPDTQYQFQISSDGFSSVNFSSVGVSNNLLITGLSPNTSYQLGLTALNFSNLASSRTVFATTSTLAGNIGSFTAFTPAGVGISSLSVSFSAGENSLLLPTSFNVQISTDANFAVFSTSDTYALTVTTQTLTPNTSYYFRARTYGRGGDLGIFNASIATFTLTSSPAASGFIINKSSISVNIASNGNAPGTQYQFQISSDGFSSVNFSSVGVSNNLLITGLSPNTSYQLGLTALNFSNLASSRTVFATTSTLAGNIGSFTAFTPAGVGISSLSVSFSAGENSLLLPTSFNVQISTDANFAVFSTSDTYALTVTTQTLTPNISYYFRARTYGRGGDLGVFNASIATFTLTSSPAASGFVINKSSISVNIASNGNAPGTQYQFQISSDGFSSVNFSSVGVSNNLLITGLSPNTSYQLGLTALNFSNLASSRTVFATTSTLAGNVGSFTAFTPAGVGISSLSVSFSAGENSLLLPTSFNVQISTDANFAVFSASDTYALTVTTQTLTPNTSYYFRARTYGRGGDLGNFNSSISTVTLAASPSSSGFVVFRTSVQVNVLAGLNPIGSSNETVFRVEASSNGFTSVDFSSSGRFNSTSQSLVVQGLQANTTYQIAVTALSRNNLRSTRTIVSDSTGTLTAIPGDFSILVSSNIGISSITVSWTPNGNPLVPPTSYQVQVSTDINFGTFSSSETFVLSVTTQTLTPNTSYYFRARAYSVGGGVSEFNTVIASYTKAAAPVLSSFRIFETSASVILNANLNPSGTQFQLQVSSTGFGSVNFSSAGASTSLVVNGLQANTTYQLGLVAVNQLNFVSTLTVFSSTSTLAKTPGSFTAFSPAGVGISSLTVAWDANNNPLVPATSYQVQISTDINFGVFSTSETFVLTVTTQTLTPNTSYYFKVRAYGRGGDSSNFNTVIATYTLTRSPAATGFNIYRTSINVTLASNGNASSTQYQLQVSSDGFTTVNFSSAGAATNLNVDGLQANTTYQVGIVAVNQVNLISSRTIVSSTSTLVGVPGGFITLSLSSVTLNSIQVTWGNNENPLTPPTSYQLQISTNEDFSAASSSETFVLTASTTTRLLTVGTTHYFRVKAYGRGGDESAFNTTLSTWARAVAPTLQAFRLESTSATVTLGSAGNVSGVTFTVSTGSFAASNSSSVVFGSGSTNLALPGLTPNSTYTIRVKVNEQQSDLSFAIASDTYTLAAKPTVSAFVVGSDSLTVVFGHNGNPAGTGIILSSNSFGIAGSTVGVVSGDATTTLVLGGLTPNGVYSLDLGAFGSAPSASTQSSLGVEISTAMLPVAPALNVNATTLGSFLWISGSSITVTWDSNGNQLTPATSYQVLVSTDENFGVFSTSNTFSLFVTTGSDARPLSSGSTYYFRISAYGRGGTNSVQISTSTIAKLGAPSLITNLRVPSVGISSMTITWSDTSVNEDGYKLLSSSGGVLASTDANKTSITLVNLEPDTLIDVRVVGFNEAGASTSTISISSHSLAKPTTGFQFVEVEFNRVAVNWNSNGNPSTVIYEIQQTSISAAFDSFVTTPVPFSNSFSQTTTTIHALQVSTTYFFRIRARNRDSITTSFDDIVLSTRTLDEEVLISTGQLIDLGLTTVQATTGVVVKPKVLEDGTSYQVLISTIAEAIVTYGNGFVLELSPTGAETRVTPSTTGIIVASSATVFTRHSGFEVESSSGVSEYDLSSDSRFSVTFGTGSIQTSNIVVPGNSNIELNFTFHAILNSPVTFSLPKAAFESNTTVNARFVSENINTLGAVRAFQAPSIIRGLGLGIELSANAALQAEKRIDVKVNYSGVNLAGRDPAWLTIARFSPEANTWIPGDSSHDFDNKLLTLSSIYLGRYQLVTQAPATDLEDVKVFPNPLRLHLGSLTQMTFTNLLANSEVKIYTLLGEKVKELKADARGEARWDARNSSGNRVASGVYFAIIKGGGQERTFKVAVEK